MSHPDATSPEWMRGFLAGSAPGGQITDCRVDGPRFVRDYSSIYYAECPGFPTPLAVKLCRDKQTGRPDAATARQQYEALQQVHRHMAGSIFTVPRPYLFSEFDGVLVIEWIDGASMTDALFAWNCGSGQARQLMARAADWLRAFHKAHALPPGRLDVEVKLGAIAEMKSSTMARNTVFFEALSTLDQTASAAESTELPRSWIHGDFKTDNLMVNDHRTTGIDIHICHENVVLYDLAPFINHLELNYCHPKGWRLALAGSESGPDFAHRYLGDEYAAAALPLAWVRLYLLLGGWTEADTAGMTGLRGAIARTCYRRLASRLAKELRRYCQT